MIRIAFCEDEKPQSEYIVALIEAFGKSTAKHLPLMLIPVRSNFCFAGKKKPLTISFLINFPHVLPVSVSIYLGIG